MKFAKALAVPVVSVALLASGCGTSGNVAAKVGDDEVLVSEVDLFADAQCELSRGGEGASGPVSVPKRALRNQALDALVDLELFRQLAAGRDADYDRAMYRAQMSQVRTQVEPLPADQRETVVELLSDYWRGVFQLQDIAEATLADQGVAEPTREELQQASTEIYTEFRKSVDIELNPAFSPDADDFAGRGDGSLSTPLSPYARQATSAEPDATFISGLPPALRCG